MRGPPIWTLQPVLRGEAAVWTPYVLALPGSLPAWLRVASFLLVLAQEKALTS